ncbi:murein hydrolase activator EnvC family protein [Paenibacillus yanchengensis]|uniref:Murein hydrolase activator EnvC family protein n=1 Tax=Paenibacillus yanchengensis TaxID=2035833 RepID=A0ABW4YMY1_9BACL
MKRLATLVIVIAMLIGISVQMSEHLDARSLSQIEKQISEAKKKASDAKRRAEQATNDAKATAGKRQMIAVKKEDAQHELTAVLGKIDKIAGEMIETEVKINGKNKELAVTEEELTEVEKRIVERDELLQSRMRLMYTNGTVSYIDVLLSATSFSDFLFRFDALQSILHQDRQILDEHKHDKELVELKQKEIELQLINIQELYSELSIQKVAMEKQEKEKEVLIASYNATISELDQELEALESINEEQEKMLVALAAEMSKLETEKKKIKTPYSGGKLAMPIDSGYRVTSKFGSRTHPISKKRHVHSGMDFGAPTGTSIYAAEGGVVIVSQYWGTYGNAVVVDHGNGLWTLYAHIKNGGLLVDKGDTVKRGQKIAEVGNTGNSTGPHLHFEVRKNEIAVNPGSYLK